MACHRASSSDSGEAGDNHIPHVSSSPEGGRPGSPGLSCALSGLPGWLADSWPEPGGGVGCTSAPLKLQEVLEPPARRQSPRQAGWHPSRYPASLPPLACLAFVSWEFTQTVVFPQIAWSQRTGQEKSCEESVLAETSPRPLVLTDLLAETAFVSGFVQPQMSKAACVKIAVIIWQERVYSRQGIWGDIYKYAQVNSIMRACSDRKALFLLESR